MKGLGVEREWCSQQRKERGWGEMVVRSGDSLVQETSLPKSAQASARWILLPVSQKKPGHDCCTYSSVRSVLSTLLNQGFCVLLPSHPVSPAVEDIQKLWLSNTV